MSRTVSVPYDALLVAYQNHADDDMERFDWDVMLDDFRDTACSLWPSLDPADKWHSREDHVLAESEIVQFGVSDYYGLVALWIRPRTDRDPWTESLAKGWTRRIRDKFSATFGELRHIGTASNGEAFYETL